MRPDDHELSDIFESIRGEDAKLAAASGVEARLRAEVGSIARARRRRVVIMTLAAAAVIAVAVVPWNRGARTSAPVAPPRQTQTPAAETATAFFPLTYSSLPLSNAQLVRVRVPRSALASFGLAPIDLPDGAGAAATSATVPADVLVGEDGVARAVRFVSR